MTHLDRPDSVMATVGVRPPAARSRGHAGRFRVAGALALAIGVAACGGEDKQKNPTQVVARVNGTEITIHEVNNELARMGVQGGTDKQQTTKRVLDMLIDQQLLVQQAAASKLERDPQVMQALEQMRRRMLSEVWLERNVNAPRPTNEEVKKFYAENPALFQKRRVYSFRDFVIERPQFSDALRKRLDAARAPSDVVAVLKEMNLNYREAASVRAAEQLPLDMLPKVAAMAKGDISILLTGTSAILMQLIDSSEQPIALAQATPFIEQYLLNHRKKELAEGKLKDLRAGAKVEYVGAFEKADGGPKPQPAPPAANPATGAPQAEVAPHDESVRKGLKGLAR